MLFGIYFVLFLLDYQWERTKTDASSSKISVTPFLDPPTVPAKIFKSCESTTNIIEARAV